MKKAFRRALAPLAGVVVLLVLNLCEIDDYEFGTETPPAPGSNVPAGDPVLGRVFPELKFIHACPGCGECVHPFEIVENRRGMSLRDHDGWYKLFWAADEVYYYSDPAGLLADWGRNRSAETPRGSWNVRLRAAAATHGKAPAHDCGQIPREIALSYELVASDIPLEDTFHSGDGPLRILRTFPWLAANTGRPRSLGWRLVGDPQVAAAACPCAKP
jgi:hypothetical protein